MRWIKCLCMWIHICCAMAWEYLDYFHRYVLLFYSILLLCSVSLQTRLSVLIVSYCSNNVPSRIWCFSYYMYLLLIVILTPYPVPLTPHPPPLTPHPHPPPFTLTPHPSPLTPEVDLPLRSWCIKGRKELINPVCSRIYPGLSDLDRSFWPGPSQRIVLN